MARLISALKADLAVWDMIRKSLESKALTRIIIEGPPGIGKTSMAYKIMREVLKCKDIMSIHFNEDLTATELTGHFVPMGDHFEKFDGKLVQAASNGLGLILNEAGRASAAVQDLLLMILDDSVGKRIETPLGKWEISPEMVVVATTNSPVSSLDPALADRFEGVFKVNVPCPDIVNNLNRLVAGLGDVVLNSYSDTKNIIMPRRALAVAKLIKAGFAVDKAAEIAMPGLGIDLKAALTLRNDQ